MTDINTMAGALRESHPITIAYIERLAREAVTRYPKLKEDKVPGGGEWVEVCYLEPGDIVSILDQWYEVLASLQTAKEFYVIFDGQAEGTVLGFKCFFGEMWYRKKKEGTDKP